VGAYGYDNPETSEGRAFVYYGSGLPRVITYTYDLLNRLTNADRSTGESFAYQYDGVGNRTVVCRILGMHGGTLPTTVCLPTPIMRPVGWCVRRV
jgi:YD repeat-containing protein